MNINIKAGRITFLFLMISSLMFTATQAISVQAGQSELAGEVRDTNNAVVASVRVSLIPTATGRTVETKTDENGTYLFTNQRHGLYRVEFTATGFNKLIRESVTLTTGERVRIDDRLQVGGLEQTVTVNSDAPLLRSETSSLGQVIDNKKVVDLPLNGRNFLSLVGLAPGVAAPVTRISIWRLSNARI